MQSPSSHKKYALQYASTCVFVGSPVPYMPCYNLVLGNGTASSHYGLIGVWLKQFSMRRTAYNLGVGSGVASLQCGLLRGASTASVHHRTCRSSIFYSRKITSVILRPNHPPTHKDNACYLSEFINFHNCFPCRRSTSKR